MRFHVIRLNPAPGRLRVALFDFDGTVSLLRSGWQQIMMELISEMVPRLNGEGDADIYIISRDLVYRTNGLPTLFQMQALADLVRGRGGSALDAAAYKRLFLDRLWDRVRPRLADIESHTVEPEVWQVPGVKRLLEALRLLGIPCYLASGSDQKAVRAETAALGLHRYFVGIYGATSDAAGSTKAALYARLVLEHNLGANELVTFGDGVEEIRLAKEIGGIAVGIARDETNPASIDADQSARLIAAGADVIIGDFRIYDGVIDYLFDPPK